MKQCATSAPSSRLEKLPLSLPSVLGNVRFGGQDCKHTIFKNSQGPETKQSDTWSSFSAHQLPNHPSPRTRILAHLLDSKTKPADRLSNSFLKRGEKLQLCLASNDGSFEWELAVQDAPFCGPAWDPLSVSAQAPFEPNFNSLHTAPQPFSVELFLLRGGPSALVWALRFSCW